VIGLEGIKMEEEYGKERLKVGVDGKVGKSV